jgi:DNA-binding GntR family transcriptional regulator
VESHDALLSAIERGAAREAEELAIAHFEDEGALIIGQRLQLLTKDEEVQ